MVHAERDSFYRQREYGNYSDRQLLSLLRRRDQRAFTTIYNRHWGFVYAHLYKMLRNEEEAKDGVQEIFSNLWIKAEQLKSDENLAGLLFCSARNLVFNLIEKDHVRQSHLKSLALFVSAVSPVTVDRIDEKALKALIDHQIERLPPKMREIFELSRKHDLSHQEIADRLDISYETVKKQIQNALKVLKLKISHLGFLVLFIFFF